MDASAEFVAPVERNLPALAQSRSRPGSEIDTENRGKSYLLMVGFAAEAVARYPISFRQPR